MKIGKGFDLPDNRVPQELRDRISISKEPRKYLKRTSNSEAECLCPLCDAVLWTMKDGKVIVSASYTDVIFQMHDGTKHSTPLCNGCARSLNDEKMEQAYLSNILQDIEEENFGGKIDIDMMMKRIPVKHQIQGR